MILLKRHVKYIGDKYDYSKVEYKNARTKVCIICLEHGEFWQKPNDHLNGHGCKKCKIDNIKNILSDTTETFIKKAHKVHGNKYDYSKVEYIKSQTKVCIICSKHGDFWQTPNDHLQGKECQKCSLENKNTLSKNTETFIKEAKEIHRK